MLAVVSLVSGCSSDSSNGPTDTSTNVTAPILENPEETARELVTTWLTALKNEESVEDLVSENFQIQRADGSGADKEVYLDNPAKVLEFTINEDISASQSGNTLSVRWSILVSEDANGVTYQDVSAPRLTVFEWIDDRWLIVGYANFNPSVPTTTTP
jgi:hypothetical protein